MPKKVLEDISSDKIKPNILIVGRDSITSVLAKELSHSECEIVELESYPKSGRFHYIFQFTGVDLANQAYIRHLKSDGKLLFIDCEDENIENIVVSERVRILRVGLLSLWDKEKLIGKISKTMFSQSIPGIVDIRKSPVAGLAKTSHKELKNKAISKSQDKGENLAKTASQISPFPQQASPTMFSAKLVYRSFSKNFIILGLVFILLLLTSAISATWYILSFRQSIYDLKNHIAISDWAAVSSDLADTRKKLKVVDRVYSISNKILVPFRNTTFMINTGDLLISTDKFLSVSESAIALLKDFGSSNKNVFAGYTFFSEETYQQAIGTIDSLLQSADVLKTKSMSVELPYFPREDILNILISTTDELTSARKVLPVFKDLFITENQKTYLFLFQNNMELRATGGFIGSVGFLTVVSGRIVDFKIVDVYTIDGQLNGHVEPPEAIRKYFSQPNWFLRDSNFDPDFALSALQAQWFVQKTINRSTDGVIGIDLYFVQNLLSAIGPVTLTDFNNEVITADNLFLKAQLFIEKDFFAGSTQKKDFLTSVAKAIENRITSADNLSWFKLFSLTQKALEQKDIMIYVNDEVLQQEIESMGWAGRMVNIRCAGQQSNCIPDYLSINESNFGVNKANYFVSKKITVEKVIDEKGDIVTNLTLTYDHRNTPQILQAGPYVNYLRIFVPKDSQISNASLNNVSIDHKDIDIENYQNDKTVFGLLIKIAPQNKGIFKISYTTPKKLTAGVEYYQFYLQKQAGDKISPVELILQQPKAFRFYPANFQTVSKSDSDISHVSDTAVDRVFSFAVK